MSSSMPLPASYTLWGCLVMQLLGHLLVGDERGVEGPLLLPRPLCLYGRGSEAWRLGERLRDAELHDGGTAVCEMPLLEAEDG